MPMSAAGAALIGASKCLKSNGRFTGQAFPQLSGRVQHTNHVWSWDIVESQRKMEPHFSILTLIKLTGEGLATHVAWLIPGGM